MYKQKYKPHYSLTKSPTRVTLIPKLAAICRQLRIPSQWEIDQLIRQQINQALHSDKVVNRETQSCSSQPADTKQR